MLKYKLIKGCMKEKRGSAKNSFGERNILAAFR